jgi:signal transduction histidine kinase
VSAAVQGTVGRAAGRRPASSRSAIVLGLIAAGISGTAVGVIVAEVPWSDPVDTPGLVAGSLLTASFMFFGVFVVARRPGDRIGLLMIAVAVAFMLPLLAWIPTDLTWTLGVGAFEQFWLVVLGHLFLAFPSGRLTSAFDRGLVITAYAWWFLIEILIVASLDPGVNQWPYDNPFLVIRDADAAQTINAVQAVGTTAIGLLFLYAIFRHWRRATPAGRRILLPIVWASVPTIIVVVTRFLNVFGIDTEIVTDSAFGLFALTALPVGFAVGLLRSRLGRSQVAELVVELGEAQKPGRARDSLAAILRDPSLRIAYRIPDSPGYVDEAGRSISIDEPGRAVTPIERGGEQIAALVHDPALAGDPDLLRSAVAATRLAVENERLAAEVRAQLEEVRASRERIVEAGDVERRRVERNLHDGAQQRLVTLSLAMRRLRDEVPDEAVAMMAAPIDALLAELRLAIEELRELARGIHPAILTEEGIAGAVASLADRSGVPVRIEGAPDGRFPDAIEATVYFVVAECLANVAKYASATRATIAITVSDGILGVAVADDGIGGADVAKGTGLRGLLDRVEAVGGRLAVESSPGIGTVVRAEVPLDGR